MSSGVLFLSHQGFSFIDDLLAVAKGLGLEGYVLSSQPAPSSSHRKQHLSEKADWVYVTSGPALTFSDVSHALDTLQGKGKRVLACLSVWEGYRAMMAKANALQEAVDNDPELIGLLTDKLALRRRLVREGLSEVNTRLLTQRSLERAKRRRERAFIKPRRGLGSFGAFPLKADTQWEYITQTRREMEKDYEYASLFGKNKDFVLEDFIGGTEVSFEVLSMEGRLHLVAVHEKLEVEHTGRTVLENVSTSPPLSLPLDTIKRGERFLRKVFRRLGIRTGCFHVEAKWNGNKWEIIEINPRVGGALIKESVKVVAEGADMLELWLRILTARGPIARELVRRRLRRIPPLGGTYRTFFKVYFGQPGARIRSVRQATLRPRPALMKIAVQPGTRLPNSSREIFLGQALWKLKNDWLTEFEAVRQASKKALEVRYERAI